MLFDKIKIFIKKVRYNFLIDFKIVIFKTKNKDIQDQNQCTKYLKTTFQNFRFDVSIDETCS